MASTLAQLVADAMSKTSQPPGQDAADRIAGRVFDRIEYDGTLIRQNVAEEIRQGLLVRDAERTESGDADLLIQMINASEKALHAIEYSVLPHYQPGMSVMEHLGNLYQLTHRLKKQRGG
jgi:hypothetical protein